MKSVWLLLLSTIVVTHSQDKVGIELDYDPCTFKTCANDETCRIVIQRESLEIAIAICVAAPEKDNTDINECINYSDGTNILNCQTEEEWTDLGSNYCKSQGLSMRSTKVKHICHDTFVKRYLQADYTCCSSTKASGVTPLVITSTPPAATTELPAQNEIDDTPSSLSTEETTKASLKTDSDNSSNTSLIPLLIGVAVIVLLVVVTTYLLYRKRKSLTVNKGKGQPTVIVNPYCHDHRYTFTDALDMSSYTPAPGKLN